MNRNRQEFELSLYDLSMVLRRRSKWILALTCAACLFALTLSFTVTPRYESMVSLLPGRSNAVSTFIPMLERGKIQGGVKFGNVTTRNSQNLEVMASDRLQYRLIDELELVTFYGHGDLMARDSSLAMAKTLVDLRRDTHFGLSLQLQVLFTRVTTTDAEMSARIANRYLDLLDEVNLERYHRFAADKARFLDTRLANLGEEILQADRNLSRFHQRHGFADFEEEQGNLFNLTNRLQQRLLNKELALASLSTDVGPDGPERIQLEAEIAVFTAMLEKLSASFGSDGAGTGGGNIPDMEARYDQLKRERRLLQAVEEQLIGERESARLQSIMDTGTTTVLDRAYVSNEPVWPDRKLIVGLTTAIAMLLCGLATVAGEYLLFLGEGSLAAGWRRLLRQS